MSDPRYSGLVRKAMAVREQIIERHLTGTLVYERDMAALAHEILVTNRIGDDFSVGQLFNVMGAIEFHRGHLVAAYDYVYAAYRCFEPLNQPERTISTLNNLGEIHRQWGKHEEALRYYWQAYNMAITEELWELVAMLLSNTGLVYLERGEYPQALEYFQQALSYSGRLTPRPSLESETYSAMARAYLALGEPDKARDATHHALAIGQQYNHSHDIAFAYRTLGVLAARHPEYGDSPETFFRQSRDIYYACGARADYARTLLAEADWRLQTDPEVARQTLHEAISIFSELKLEDEAVQARRLLSHL